MFRPGRRNFPSPTPPFLLLASLTIVAMRFPINSICWTSSSAGASFKSTPKLCMDSLSLYKKRISWNKSMVFESVIFSLREYPHCAFASLLAKNFLQLLLKYALDDQCYSQNLWPEKFLLLWYLIIYFDWRNTFIINWIHWIAIAWFHFTSTSTEIVTSRIIKASTFCIFIRFMFRIWFETATCYVRILPFSFTNDTNAVNDDLKSCSYFLKAMRVLYY